MESRDFESGVIVTVKNIKIFYSQYMPKNINKFKNKNLFAFAGIGNPNSFFQLLKDNNLNLKKPAEIDFNIEKNINLGA